MQTPIGDYALLGDTRAAALVSRDGSIDWLCIPRFDADPVFGHLVDAEHGGRFEVSVRGVVTHRSYRSGSAVLETTWAGSAGAATVTDAMVLDVSGFRPQLALVRQVVCTAGRIDLDILFDPRLGLPGVPPRTGWRNGAPLCTWGSLAVVLQTFPMLQLTPGERLTHEMSAGDRITMVLSLADRTPAVLVSQSDAEEMVRDTDARWRDWSRDIQYQGPFGDAVVRSLVTLRLLIYSPSGAPVAAPTTSLPEAVGAGSNWDYRYAWPRDAGIGSGAFMALGKREEAAAFLRWLEVASRLTLPRMSVLYTLDGTEGHAEREIEGVSGYRGSLPVRVSNLASRQHQLDVYGWVIDTAWHLVSMGRDLDGPSRRMVRDLADFVTERWADPDAGIWERRDDDRQNVSSKLMAYVALDRAARMADPSRAGPRRARRWRDAADALRDSVMEHGWSPNLNSYSAEYGRDSLDASLLLLPMSALEPPDSPRVALTIARVRERLGADGPLLYRYLPDTGEPDEGAFLPCTFWLVDALARTGRIEEAEGVMGEALALGSELGLFAEEMDPATGEMLGNHPQALSHATLVTAALSIEAARDEGSRPG